MCCIVHEPNTHILIHTRTHCTSYSGHICAHQEKKNNGFSIWNSANPKTTCTVSILRFKPIASAAIQHLITWEQRCILVSISGIIMRVWWRQRGEYQLTVTAVAFVGNLRPVWTTTTSSQCLARNWTANVMIFLINRIYKRIGVRCIRTNIWTNVHLFPGFLVSGS